MCYFFILNVWHFLSKRISILSRMLTECPSLLLSESHNFTLWRSQHFQHANSKFALKIPFCIHMKSSLALDWKWSGRLYHRNKLFLTVTSSESYKSCLWSPCEQLIWKDDSCLGNLEPGIVIYYWSWSFHTFFLLPLKWVPNGSK